MSEETRPSGEEMEPTSSEHGDVAAGTYTEEGERVYDTEIRGRLLLWLALGLVGLVAVAGVLVYFLYLGFVELETRAQPPAPILEVERAPIFVPGARLLPEPERSLAEVRAEYEALATSYGWVDESAGIARIPIERAIELVAERGLPTASADAGEEPPVGAVTEDGAEREPGAADVLSVQEPEEPATVEDEGGDER